MHITAHVVNRQAGNTVNLKSGEREHTLTIPTKPDGSGFLANGGELLLLALATGWLYGAVALLTATWLLVMAHHLHARVCRGEPVEPLRLFQRSNHYLAAVFFALAVDSVLALPTVLGPAG